MPYMRSHGAQLKGGICDTTKAAENFVVSCTQGVE